ncbi:MAG: hypothetical protein DWI18_01185, partial [Planctomycetota bacterium]
WIMLLTRGREPLKHWIHAHAYRRPAKFDPRLKKIRGVMVGDHAHIIESKIEQDQRVLAARPAIGFLRAYMKRVKIIYHAWP